MANPSSPNGEDTQAASDTVRRDTETVSQTARDDFNQIKQRAEEDFDAVKREAKSEFDKVRNEAGSFVEGQKNYAADQMEGIASAFDRIGGELQSGEASWAGRYARDAAHRLEDIARKTRNSSLNELVGDVEQFGRQRPGAFLATAALLGFAASRFLTASSQRRSGSSGQRYSSGAYEGDPYYGSRDDGIGSSTYGESQSFGSRDGDEK